MLMVSTRKKEKYGDFPAGELLVLLVTYICLQKTLRISREDWGTLGKIREITSPAKNPIIFFVKTKIPRRMDLTYR